MPMLCRVKVMVVEVWRRCDAMGSRYRSTFLCVEFCRSFGVDRISRKGAPERNLGGGERLVFCIPRLGNPSFLAGGGGAERAAASKLTFRFQPMPAPLPVVHTFEPLAGFKICGWSVCKCGALPFALPRVCYPTLTRARLCKDDLNKNDSKLAFHVIKNHQIYSGTYICTSRGG